MENDKTPGKDGLSKEFYEVFWDDVKFHYWHQIMMLLLKKNYVPLKSKR